GGIRDFHMTGVQTCTLPIFGRDRVSDFAECRDGDFDFDRRYIDEDYFEMASPGFGPDGIFYREAGRYLDGSSVVGDLDRGLASRPEERRVWKAGGRAGAVAG